ncbi:hypothetical protein [Ureibacillus acetophenoni]|uniref:YfzA-like protein n=1 Tax=Ureibacillus acetophenoni TaxID=614649 RepID=A0A285UEB8_9BACL|nr:hypothetical protein [Ureibacillus acetophenoni]SOC40265.1 hypothetical protein SAMN05877842_107161 [Ureibacillus acetophenoni]
MYKKGWVFLGIAGFLALWSILLFGEGYGYYNSILNDFLYVSFFGEIVKVTTVDELNTYAYLYMALSLIPAILAVYLYRKFLKIVPAREFN